jgi:hypothetical protein
MLISNVRFVALAAWSAVAAAAMAMLGPPAPVKINVVGIDSPEC